MLPVFQYVHKTSYSRLSTCNCYLLLAWPTLYCPYFPLPLHYLTSTLLYLYTTLPPNYPTPHYPNPTLPYPHTTPPHTTLLPHYPSLTLLYLHTTLSPYYSTSILLYHHTTQPSHYLTSTLP